MKRKIEDKLYELLGDEYGGSVDVPLANRTLKWVDKGHVDRVVAFNNDAFDIGFGYWDRWQIIMPRKEFHKAVRWYLRQWAFGEWFGLRRWLWYTLLSRRIKRHSGMKKSDAS